MGEDFSSTTPIRMNVKIIGTNTIQQVDIIKNNKIIYTTSPNRSEVEFQFLENDTDSKQSYYYVRVQQQDGEMAWGSPVWVTYNNRGS